jgi:hypothetical protein
LPDNARPDELRAAALDGSIEALMTWHPVQPGDFFHVPAGTVHAIGAGLSLVEIQQNVDLTYRLYDYGRPRPLQLDESIAAARAGRLRLPRSVRLARRAMCWRQRQVHDRAADARGTA